ncbi:MAG: sigma-70 family RNA polymerase sigma factor [Candidatus Micrarchaeia archaeon]
MAKQVIASAQAGTAARTPTAQRSEFHAQKPLAERHRGREMSENKKAIVEILEEYRHAGSERRLKIEEEICEKLEGMLRKIASNIAASSRAPDRINNELEDLLPEGRARLIWCIRNFDRDSATLITYAYKSVKGEYLNYLRDKSGGPSLGRKVQANMGKVSRQIDAFRAENEREPTAAELAEGTGLEEEFVREVLAAMELKIMPLQGAQNSAGELIDISEVVPDAARLTPEAVLEQLRVREFIRQTCSNETQQKIVRLYFLLDWTQKEIAEHLKIGQMQVSRKIAKWRKAARGMMWMLDGGMQPEDAKANGRPRTNGQEEKRQLAVEKNELFTGLLPNLQWRNGSGVLPTDAALVGCGKDTLLERIEFFGGREAVAQMMSRKYRMEIEPA